MTLGLLFAWVSIELLRHTQDYTRFAHIANGMIESFILVEKDGLMKDIQDI